MNTKGFIGLGVMGFPMAGHISKEYQTEVYNRSESKSVDWAARHSGTVAYSPEDLGSTCNEIFMCIGNDDDVREVISGKKGILNSMQAEGIIVDHTTTSSELANEMYKLCLKKNIYYVDAPVSGGQAGAENGALTIMAGG
ncbi:MAG: NAD(P)-dependent oxidoreductase, partial [Gammaproteobacteria bacterium]